MKSEFKISGLRGLASAVGMGLVGAAVIQEMRKPSSERAWHGLLWERVPYEFRLPTVERLRHAYWAPQDPHVLTGTPFGVGWTVNFGRLARACSSRCTTLTHSRQAA